MIVDHAAAVTEQFQLMVEKADIEGCVVDHQLGALEVDHQVIDDVVEARLVCKKVIADAVDLQRAFVDRPVRLYVLMVVVSGQTAIDQFDAADFDDAVALAGFQAGGFSIEDDLAGHGLLFYFIHRPQSMLFSKLWRMVNVSLYFRICFSR